MAGIKHTWLLLLGTFLFPWMLVQRRQGDFPFHLAARYSKCIRMHSQAPILSTLPKPLKTSYFSAECEGFPLRTGGRKPQLADKEGQPGSSWVACPGSGLAPHPAALPGSGLQLCCSGTSFKKQMWLFFILLLSFAAFLQTFVFCRLLSHQY